jgi:hypothetical protein
VKTYKIEITKEEIEAGIIQLGARLDYLAEQQKIAMKHGDAERVVEIHEFTIPIRNLKNKLANERYRV